MALPKNPNAGGGLPGRPGGGLPIPNKGGLPNVNRPGGEGKKPQESNSALPNLGDFTRDNPNQERPGVPRQPASTGAPRPEQYPEGRYGIQDRLGDYDFGARRVDERELSRERESLEQDDDAIDYSPIDELDDLAHGPLEGDAMADEEDRRLREEVEARREREAAARFNSSMDTKKSQGKINNNALKDDVPQEESPSGAELDENGQNVFIDEKTKTVKPFGGKKSAVKSNNLDRRKNMRQQARIVQFVVIGLVVVTLGFAAKNAFMPPQGLTADDVVGLVYQTTNTTAFPLEQGGFYAENFMDAYLNYDPNDKTSTSLLAFYSEGALSSDGAPTGLEIPENFQQKVVGEPHVFKSRGTSANSAVFTVGALVKVNNTSVKEEGEEIENNSENQEMVNGTLTWKFFDVNVYYNSELNAFNIVGNPGLVPTPAIASAMDIPADMPLADEMATAEAIEAVTPTIYGFLSAYKDSSSTNYEALLPFLPSDPDVNLLKGLNGEYDFKGGKASPESVAFKLYPSNTNEYKALATVQWVQNVAGTYSVTTSDYIITLQEVSGGYKVTKMDAWSYLPDIPDESSDSDAG